MTAFAGAAADAAPVAEVTACGTIFGVAATNAADVVCVGDACDADGVGAFVVVTPLAESARNVTAFVESPLPEVVAAVLTVAPFAPARKSSEKY